MEPKVVYQNESLLILNKPAGWVVNDAITTNNQLTIQSWLLRNFQFPVFNNKEYRAGIVHRLDKETSGVLLIAKTGKAYDYLQKQFKNRVVSKTYFSLVHGIVGVKEGEIKASVGRLPWNRERFGVLPGGREATTLYKVGAYYKRGKDTFTLMELNPKTGRTHQIRIHLKYLGHPIVSDSFYAGRKTARRDRIWCPRLFLHAASITFKDPINGKMLTFSCELPDELRHVLTNLKKI